MGFAFVERKKNNRYVNANTFVEEHKYRYEDKKYKLRNFYWAYKYFCITGR